MFLNSCSFFKSVLQPFLALLVSLLLLPWANAVSYPGSGTPVAIPDPGSVDVTFTVSGQTAPITNISVDVNFSHGWAGDVRLQLIAPNGTSLDLVNALGGPSGNDDFSGLYTFVDPATPGAGVLANQPSIVSFLFPPGAYITSTAGAVPTNLLATFAALSTAQINGTWTLRAYDVEAIIAGTVSSTTLNIVGTVVGTNAVCGTPPASIIAPSGAALCSSGTGTAVTSGVTTFTWGCNSTDGGTNTAANACSSIRQYAVTATPSAGATGSISCTTPVNGGGTTSCTASPAMGYITGSISGCGGAATGSGVNAYTTAAVVADCTVTATFLQIVNGTCGAANSVAVHDAPSAGLCGTGTASVVATAAGQFTWTCDGANTGTNASCAAPRTYLLTASVSGGNGTATAAAGGVVAYNAAGTVTITPNAGYSTITPLGGTCTGSLVGTTFTSNPMTADCSLIASFLQLPIAPTTAVSPASGGSVSCVGPAIFGGTSTCTASPAAGYLFTGFSGCGGTPTSSLTYVTGAITGACLVTASFTSVSIPTLSPMFLAVLALLALLVGGFSLRRRVL
ncbi:MAG: proprotein convertase P-domain-containing protein [Casimicrobium sp.]